MPPIPLVIIEVNENTLTPKNVGKYPPIREPIIIPNIAIDLSDISSFYHIKKGLLKALNYVARRMGRFSN